MSYASYNRTKSSEQMMSSTCHSTYSRHTFTHTIQCGGKYHRFQATHSSMMTVKVSTCCCGPTRPLRVFLVVSSGEQWSISQSQDASSHPGRHTLRWSLFPPDTWQSLKGTPLHCNGFPRKCIWVHKLSVWEWRAGQCLPQSRLALRICSARGTTLLFDALSHLQPYLWFKVSWLHSPAG